uniref:Uncharacterized protein n=1 Tax=Oryza rufipogon TaxID=4529 RepID=A0A0E0MS32_ORYRU
MDSWLDPSYMKLLPFFMQPQRPQLLSIQILFSSARGPGNLVHCRSWWDCWAPNEEPPSSKALLAFMPKSFALILISCATSPSSINMDTAVSTAVLFPTVSLLSLQPPPQFSGDPPPISHSQTALNSVAM